MTVERILCPVDFSDVSAHAVDHAVSMARGFGARLIALHVYPALSHVHGTAAPALVDVAALRSNAVSMMSPAGAAGVETEILIEGGDIVRVILDRVATLRADLVAMGTHGASGFQHLVLGSVTEKVLRRATCPVLTVPPRAGGAPAGPYRRVLCAVDFSEPSLGAVAAAASIAARSRGSITLIHVVDWPWHDAPDASLEGIPPEQARALAEYRRYLETTAAARLAGLAATVSPEEPAPAVSVRFGKPYVELLDEARHRGADLVVMGVRGRNALDRSLFGSTTTQMVRRATCPVLTVTGG
jgi:nucleotide-binding universal stress UspA family protein